jgi:pimeloyl-ACP methyl ester carboxylesterase
MPNAALVVLEGTDHYSFLYKPVEFRGILRAFLGIGGAA